MNRSMLCAALAALCFLGAALMGGGAPFGRLALALGLPQLAAPLFADPNWRGTAHFARGDGSAAATAFNAAGAQAGYNLGTALAHAGEYAKALEALDAHLAIFPGDGAARENFELVRIYFAGTLIEPDSEIITRVDREGVTVEAEIGQGKARAASTGSESQNQGNSLELPELVSRGRLGVRRVFDDYFYEANRRWLQSVEDLPGEYLAERIKFEHKRRQSLGTGQPEAEDPS